MFNAEHLTSLHQTWSNILVLFQQHILDNSFVILSLLISQLFHSVIYIIYIIYIMSLQITPKGQWQITTLNTKCTYMQVLVEQPLLLIHNLQYFTLYLSNALVCLWIRNNPWPILGISGQQCLANYTESGQTAWTCMPDCQRLKVRFTVSREHNILAGIILDINYSM